MRPSPSPANNSKFNYTVIEEQEHQANSASKAVTSPRAHIMVMWVDNASLVRCRVVPRRRFQEYNFHVPIVPAVQSLPMMHDVAIEKPVGEVWMVPTKDTELFDISTWMDDTSVWFADMAKPSTQGKNNPGQDHDWAYCPRSFLRRQEQLLLEKHRIRATLGFELEFQLLIPHGHALNGKLPSPVDTTLYCEARAFHGNNGFKSPWKVVKRIVECLEAELLIPVNQYHPEAASGQFEISIGPFGIDNEMTVCEGVDRLVLARQCVYGIAAKYGFQATFLPKLSQYEAGSAAHTHLGLVELNSEKPSNLFASKTKKAEAFVAGILEELPAMAMLLAPSVNSYDRLQPSCWAGAFQCYGYENKEAPIRLICADEGNDFATVQRLEVKTVDATANPYVAVGALLAAGMLGLDRQSELPQACNDNPASLSEEKRPPRLPSSLTEAIQALREHSSTWEAILSPSYFDLLVRLREQENKYYGELNVDERLRQLLKRF